MRLILLTLNNVLIKSKYFNMQANKVDIKSYQIKNIHQVKVLQVDKVQMDSTKIC